MQVKKFAKWGLALTSTLVLGGVVTPASVSLLSAPVVYAQEAQAKFDTVVVLREDESGNPLNTFEPVRVYDGSDIVFDEVMVDGYEFVRAELVDNIKLAITDITLPYTHKYVGTENGYGVFNLVSVYKPVETPPVETPAEKPAEQPVEKPVETPTEQPVFHPYVVEFYIDGEYWGAANRGYNSGWPYVRLAPYSEEFPGKEWPKEELDGHTSNLPNVSMVTKEDLDSIGGVVKAYWTRKPVEQPAEKPVDQPAETSTAQPVETPTEQPTETPATTPIEQPVEQPAETPTEKPVEQPVEKPVEQPVETPTKQPAEVPTEQPTEQPVSVAVIAISESDGPLSHYNVTINPGETKTVETPKVDGYKLDQYTSPTYEITYDNALKQLNSAGFAWVQFWMIKDAAPETLVEQPAEQPAEQPVEQPAEQPVDTPTDKPVEQLTDASSLTDQTAGKVQAVTPTDKKTVDKSALSTPAVKPEEVSQPVAKTLPKTGDSSSMLLVLGGVLSGLSGLGLAATSRKRD